MAFYLDTSALVKLVAAEAETPALQSWQAEQEADLVANDMARTELLRVARRLTPAHVQVAREVLASLSLIRVGERTFEQAGLLDPPSLRSLDAVHLASAIDLGADLGGIVTYDRRLADAAALNAVTVIAPGADLSQPHG